MTGRRREIGLLRVFLIHLVPIIYRRRFKFEVEMFLNVCRKQREVNECFGGVNETKDGSDVDVLD